MTIYKYPLEITDRQVIDMPDGAKILTVQVQHEVPCVWAPVDPDVASVPRYFTIYGTGHPCSAEGQYVGTFLVHGGALVFHIFEG